MVVLLWAVLGYVVVFLVFCWCFVVVGGFDEFCGFWYFGFGFVA